MSMSLVLGNAWGEGNLCWKKPPEISSQVKGKQELQTCSLKLCDNFLVHLDFFTIFGVSFCVTWNSLSYFKKELKSTVQ